MKSHKQSYSRTAVLKIEKNIRILLIMKNCVNCLRFEVQVSLNFQTFKEKVHSIFTQINLKQLKAN